MLENVVSTDGVGSGWLWLIVILFILTGGSIGGFGGANGFYANQADLQRGFDTQNFMMRFDTLSQNQANNNYQTAQLINQANVQGLQNTYGLSTAMNNGFDGIQMQINNLAHQMEQCCCNIKTQLLQDKYDDARYQLEQANTAVSNAVQTQNILGNLGRWYANPSVNPYLVYGNGTTIA